MVVVSYFTLAGNTWLAATLIGIYRNSFKQFIHINKIIRIKDSAEVGMPLLLLLSQMMLRKKGSAATKHSVSKAIRSCEGFLGAR